MRHKTFRMHPIDIRLFLSFSFYLYLCLSAFYSFITLSFFDYLFSFLFSFYISSSYGLLFSNPSLSSLSLYVLISLYICCDSRSITLYQYLSSINRLTLSICVTRFPPLFSLYPSLSLGILFSYHSMSFFFYRSYVLISLFTSLSLSLFFSYHSIFLCPSFCHSVLTLSIVISQCFFCYN